MFQIAVLLIDYSISSAKFGYLSHGDCEFNLSDPGSSVHFGACEPCNAKRQLKLTILLHKGYDIV